MNTQKRKRVLVTGGANGIGKEIVTSFSNRGYRVAFCDTDKEAGERLVSELPGKPRFYHFDLRDDKALEACLTELFEQWEDLDVIINNAGLGGFAPITEMAVEDFDRILAINLRPVFLTSRLLAIHRKNLSEPNPYGRIINMASTRYLMSEPGSEAYAASKGGIYSLTHALALSLSEYNITVNSISPGWIETGNYEALSREDHLQHPSRRVGRPVDIANACLFLCEEQNNFINGENIVIDGGMTRKMIYV